VQPVEKDIAKLRRIPEFANSSCCSQKKQAKEEITSIYGKSEGDEVDKQRDDAVQWEKEEHTS
jgi:hypothetical protein